VPKSATDTLVDIYDAWQINDFDWLASYLPADFDHSMNIPTDLFELSGLRQGKTDSLDRLRKILESYETRQLCVGDLIVGPDTATVDITTKCTDRASGAWLHTTKTHIWQLEDGWPVALAEFYDLTQVAAFITSLRR